MKDHPSSQHKNLNNISYTVYGSGNPIVLIHGFAEDGSIWENQINHLSPHFKIIVPDLPGTGLSRENIPSKSNSIDDFARLILQIADTEELEQITLIGHSMGGYVTLAFAELFPERVNGMGLIHSTSFADSEEKKETRSRSVAFMFKHGIVPFLETMIPGLYSTEFAKKHPQKIHEHIKLASSFNVDVLAAYYEMMKKRPDRRHVLEGFSKPVLFIIGTEDKAVLLMDSLDQCDLPADPNVHILENVGHMGMVEEPELVNKAIESFVSYITKDKK